jgi:hypothetical protein
LVPDETITFRGSETKTLGHFELIEKLGVGAFGTVWKARDTKLDRTVAVKIPRKEQLSEQDVEQFFREAKAAAQLNHPNIVGVHEVGREEKTLFIVSDYVQGVTLAEWVTHTCARCRLDPNSAMHGGCLTCMATLMSGVATGTATTQRRQWITRLAPTGDHSEYTAAAAGATPPGIASRRNASALAR